MHKILRVFVLLLAFGLTTVGLTVAVPPSTHAFRTEQQKAPKVKEAYKLKWSSLKAQLNALDIDTGNFNVFIRGFKQEKKLEVWARSANAEWKLFQTYDMCYISGTVGPKRCQGDGQVPEGFYHVSVFNPYSNYLISLCVSYPNASDNYFGCKSDRGGAIMIHGNCVSVGCIPITDDKIREVYVLCVEAKDYGQNEIPIHIFPARLSDENLQTLINSWPDQTTHAFWKNIKDGYDYFETRKQLPKVTIDPKGKYLFN